MEVRLGDTTRSSGSESAVTRELSVELLVAHPAYNSSGRQDHDIALLRLREEADIGVFTPACLPAPGQDFTGELGILTGSAGVKQTFTSSLQFYPKVGRHAGGWRQRGHPAEAGGSPHPE